MKQKHDPALGDPVTYADLEEELSRLRAAITLLANCVGANVISSDNARRLMDLIAPPYERHKHERKKRGV